MQLHWKVLAASVLVMLAFIGVGSVSGDTNEPPDPPEPSTQPTMTSTPRWQPGQLYPPGEGALWQRNHLTLEEQQLLDRPDRTMPGDAYKAYEAAAAFNASFAEANLATSRLGLRGAEETGVVP